MFFCTISNASTAIGTFAQTTAVDAVALGESADGTAVRAIAIGADAQATHTGAISIGANAATTAIDILTVGLVGSGTATDRKDLQTSGDVRVVSHMLNGQEFFIRARTESVTFAANPGDASKVTVGTIIALGDFATQVSGRVVIAGTNCTSFSVGDGVDPDLWAFNVSPADTTTFDNVATATWSKPALANQEITVTANGGNCFDLVVALTVHYTTSTAATSD